MKLTDENTINTANKSKVDASNAGLNKLRAAVLGANDGIVSTSAVVLGVAGATSETGAIFTAGLAALVAGALSMAVGEYVSVSSQSDAEKAYVKNEKKLLETDPEGQQQELAAAYQAQGVSVATAMQVAEELTQKDPLKAHLAMEFNYDEHDVASPVGAAVVSFFAFAVGGIIPFAAILLAPAEHKIWLTGLAVVIALTITGYLSATVGNASRRRAVVRVVAGGILAMTITYLIGWLFGTSVA